MSVLAAASSGESPAALVAKRRLLLDTAPVPVVPDKTAPDQTAPAIPAEPRIHTGAIRTLGSNPATAPIMLHPGDSISTGRRILYIILLGALTALGPFTIDLYLLPGGSWRAWKPKSMPSR